MNHTRQHSRVSRGISLALGLVLAGGAALVGAAPAQAAGPIEVHASDIRPNENTYPGWHQGYADATSANYSITSEGLKLSNVSQVLYGFTPGQRVSGVDLESAVNAGQVSWTTKTGPAFFQLPVFYGDSASPSFTTLRPAAPTVGENVADLNQLWATSTAIPANDDAGTPAYAKDAEATLGEFLSALDESTVQVLGFGVLTYDGLTSVVTGLTFNGSSYAFVQDALSAGTASISGTPVVGKTLTVSTAGWPAGTAFTYEWYWNGGQMGGPIDGQTSTSYTVTNDVLTRAIGVLVTGTLPGLQPTTVSTPVTAQVTAPKKPAAPAPVSNSNDLPTYLASKGALPLPQTTTGLPAGDLDPSKTQTPNVPWAALDSFVDVYLYSTPIFVGTFPVVNGVAQITLSPAVLSKLEAGSHTLVVTGQTSGAVKSVSLSLAAVLAATGSDTVAPLTIAGLLILLGAALVVVRRRRRLHV
ncbi:LPXTG cell wall anchor domain-containing protein [Leifsonia poae]|uniref:LPXTG cell wall anchor domain-containing protein n=1 Tax=Leifsonia poae TaxID=110933 RepID=UPI001CBBB772|nr:LPXTG cell wall anchor domain-containing protein [Leifsonia poae]